MINRSVEPAEFKNISRRNLTRLFYCTQDTFYLHFWALVYKSCKKKCFQKLESI